MEETKKAFRNMTDAEQVALLQAVLDLAREGLERAHKEFRGRCYLKLAKEHDMHPLSIVSIAERAWMEAFDERSQGRVFDPRWEGEHEHVPDKPF